MTDYHTFPGLPELCAAAHPVDGSTILIRRGECGYHPCAGKSIDRLNTLWGVTPAQREAMLAGSMFGWDVPAADPQTYHADGSPRVRRPSDRREGRAEP